MWDPGDPGRELARFDGHTGGVYRVAALEWPGLDHPVIVTTSSDGTARVWDPGIRAGSWPASMATPA